MPAENDRVSQNLRLRISERKILIVEDESVLAWELEDQLRALEVSKIFIAASLTAARIVLADHMDISLVLLDLKLQDGNGEDLMDELKKRAIPWIVITGYSHPQDRTFSYPILVKPYDSKSLLIAVTQALSLSS